MLILSRKLNECIVIDGGRILVKVLRIERDTIKIGIQAPADIAIHRQEVYDLIQRNKQTSFNVGTEILLKSPGAQVTPPPLPPPLPQQ